MTHTHSSLGPHLFFARSNGECLIRALEARGIGYRYLSFGEITRRRFAERTIATFQINGVTYYFDGAALRGSDLRHSVPGPLIDGSVEQFVRRKDLLNAFLRGCGFSVPQGAGYDRRAQDGAEVFFGALSRHLPAGVCVKPAEGRKGRLVHLGIRDRVSFRKAFAAVAQHYNRVLIEEVVLGVVYRLLCVGGQVIAIRFGRPASVEGDGFHTIADLVTLKNAERKFGHKYALVLGGRELDFLTHSGLDPNFVPEPGQRIFLSDLSNLHQGADLIDATDAVHRSYIEMVERALSHWPTMVLCGADVAIEDASQPLSEANHHILEFNCLPGFNGHHYPTQGQPRDVAGAIIDFLMGKRLLDAGADSRDGGKGVRLQK